MNLLKKVSNWATGNSISYQKENDIYNEIVENINKLEGLDEYLLNDSEVVRRYTHESLENIQNYKKIKMRKIPFVQNESERNVIKKEIQNLENKLQRLIDEIKNRMLQDMELDEIQKHIATINHIIYSNGQLMAFQKFMTSNIVERRWTKKELESLRNEIAIRKQVLIPYLADINYNKR